MTGANDEPDVTTKTSPHSVADTVAKFTGMLQEKGVRVFDVIDQAAAAREVGQELRETVLVIFGNPAGGTPVMVASPMAALDLPLKVLVWDDEGETKVSYYTIASIAGRHGLSADQTKALAVIDPLTDALVS
jgi:uncharacterized protein (DUF302 family)